MLKITQNTLIPMGLAILVIGSSAAWVTKISLATAITEKSVNLALLKFEKIEQSLKDIDYRLSRIEWSLRIKKGDK